MSKTTRYLNTPRPSINVAAAENLDRNFFNILNKLGFHVVMVSFEAGPDSPIWAHSEIGEDLGRELELFKVGRFDSTFHDEKMISHVFHISDLAKAAQQLKDSLEARGLLKIATILCVETSLKLQIWWPPSAELI